MVFFILLTLIYNAKLLYFSNELNRSLSAYLTVLLLLAIISYLVCVIVGFIRVKIQDKSVLLSVLFNSSLVDVCVDSIGLYVKYNLLTFIIVCGGFYTTYMIMKGVI